RLRLALT
ncbi:transporter, AcrB/D/F family domain protein, partial [Vibrio parahaemolyticus V-223/04]